MKRFNLAWLAALVFVVLGCSGQDEVPPLPENVDEPPVVTAIKTGNLAGVRQFVESNPDAVTGVDNRGNTLLHMAAIFDQAAICEYLIEAGADPQALNGEGYTPREAAEENRIDPRVSEVLNAHGG